jgi:hypothetical protein
MAMATHNNQIVHGRSDDDNADHDNNVYNNQPDNEVDEDEDDDDDDDEDEDEDEDKVE